MKYRAKLQMKMKVIYRVPNALIAMKAFQDMNFGTKVDWFHIWGHSFCAKPYGSFEKPQLSSASCEVKQEQQVFGVEDCIFTTIVKRTRDL